MFVDLVDVDDIQRNEFRKREKKRIAQMHARIVQFNEMRFLNVKEHRMNTMKCE